MALIAFTLSQAGAQTTEQLMGRELEVTVPVGYEKFDMRNLDPNEYAPDKDPYAGASWYVSRGGRAVLAQELPNVDPDDNVFRRWFRNDIRAYVVVRVAGLVESDRVGSPERDRGSRTVVPRALSAQEVHDRFCKAFSARWGKDYTFQLFDAETGIGRCVNFMGAFVAVFTRKLGDFLVTIEAMDLVNFLVLVSKLPDLDITQSSNAEKWTLFRQAANANIAEQMLLSARLLP